MCTSLKYFSTALLGIACAGGVSSMANAQLVEYTFDGTIASGMDYAGLIDGSPSSGTALDGMSFTATFEIDTDNGYTPWDGYEPWYYGIWKVGGTTWCACTTPIVSSVFAINGIVVAAGGTSDKSNTVASPSTGGVGVELTNSSDSYYGVHIYSSNLPNSLSSPVAYSASASDDIGGNFWLVDSAGNLAAKGALLPTTLSISSVPVPGSFWMFSSGLVALVGSARKSQIV